MSSCKYCEWPDADYGWDYHTLGDETGINSLVGVVDGERPCLEVDCYYKLNELWTARLPIAFCPFCGRRLGNA